MLLKGKNVSWRVKDKGVVLSKAEVVPEKTVTGVVGDTVPKITVSGNVMDVKGNPIPGATVSLKGQPRGQGADALGRFIFTQVPANGILVISSIGFDPKQVKISGKTEIKIVLDSAIREIESFEVVSTGYQDIPKERSTGSFVQLDNKLLNRTVSTGIIDRILNVTSSLKTEKGARTSFTIRGFSTINANMKPLVVVDGFPYDENPNDGEVLLNNLNPNDIESITILRDAASASIWGARSGNGVIVVKTKKGSYNKKTSIQLNASTNFIKKPDLGYLNIIDPKDAIEVERTRFKQGLYNEYDDLYPLFDFYLPLSPAMEIMLAQRRGEITEQDANSKLNELSQHDARDDINKYLLQTGINQQYNLNVSGGTPRNSYYVSLGYDANRSSIKGDKDQRYSLRFENTLKPIDKIELSTYISYVQSDSKSNGIGYEQFLATGLTMASPYTQLADNNGNSLHVPMPFTYRTPYLDTARYPGLLDWHYRPLDELKNNNNSSKRYNTRLGGVIRYTFFEGISAEVRGQYEKRIGRITNEFNMNTYNTRNLINTYAYQDPTGKTIYPIPLGSILRLDNSDNTLWNIRTQINVNKSWHKHQINAILAYESSESKYTFNGEGKYGYNPSTLSSATYIDYNTQFMLRPNGMLGSGRIPNDQYAGGSLNRFESYLGNAAYTFNNNYSLTLSGRIDKSNFLGAKSNQRIVPLWSTGLGWNISDESFYKLLWLPYLRLRATYGYNGNLNNKATALPTAIITTTGAGGYHNEPYVSILTAPNPGLTWERIGTYNLGIDFKLFNNRMDGSLEYYKKTGENLIGTINIEPTVGTTIYTGNYASMKGSGVDLILNSINIRRAVNWRSNLVLSYNTDKITDYDQKSLTAFSYLTNFYIPVIGKPVVKLFTFPYAGLNAENGDPMGFLKGEKKDYLSMSQNAKPEDLLYIGSITPRVFGSLINTLSYKNISFSFNITYKFKYYFVRNSISYSNLFNNFGGHSDYSLRWQKAGDETKTSVPSMPAAINPTRDNFYKYSDALVEKGDHIRLQDIRLSYELGKQQFKSLPFNNISIFTYANNVGILWRANKYKLDPDVNGFSLPTPRSIAIGASVNF